MNAERIIIDCILEEMDRISSLVSFSYPYFDPVSIWFPFSFDPSFPRPSPSCSPQVRCHSSSGLQFIFLSLFVSWASPYFVFPTKKPPNKITQTSPGIGRLPSNHTSCCYCYHLLWLFCFQFQRLVTPFSCSPSLAFSVSQLSFPFCTLDLLFEVISSLSWCLQVLFGTRSTLPFACCPLLPAQLFSWGNTCLVRCLYLVWSFHLFIGSLLPAWFIYYEHFCFWNSVLPWVSSLL